MTGHLEKNNVPCHGCEDRELGCHSKCDKYKKFKKYMDDVHKKERDKDIYYERKVRIRKDKYKRRNLKY